MNSIWLSLLWKEWCEQRWKMAALTASFVLGQALLLTLFLADHPHEIAEPLIMTLGFCLSAYCILAGTFVGMTVAAGENSHKTMRFLQSLPMPMWQAGLIKLLIAVITVSLPILAAIGLVWLFSIIYVGGTHEVVRAVAQAIRLTNPTVRPWEISNWFVIQAAAGVLGASSLLLWISAGGVNRSDEVRAGAVGFLAVCASWMFVAYGINFTEKHDFYGGEQATKLLAVALPGGPAIVGTNAAMRSDYGFVTQMLVGIMGHAGVLWWFLKQYARTSVLPNVSRGTFISDFFRLKLVHFPMRSGTGAIVWKQFRESGPLALFAVIGILAVIGYIYFFEGQDLSIADLSGALGVTTLIVAGFVTLAAGIGVLIEDYSPGVNNFWRSRPINPHVWFATKYFSGLLVLLVAFGPLVLLARWLGNWGWGTFQDVSFAIILFLMIYTLSLAAYALVRQPIYAAVLTVAGYLFFGFGFSMYQNKGWLWAVGLATCLIIQILATLLAWQAVIRDWGWKQHR